jgi:hypothetical protein
MAFPSIRSQNTTNGTTGTTTPVVNLPATVVAGDILVVFIRVAVAGAIGWPNASWHEIIDASDDGADDQNAMAWKVAQGNEGGTTITLSSGNGKFSSFSYAIKDAAGDITPPQLSTVATGTTGQPNATTCTPTGGAKDYLWITFTGNEGEQTGVTTYPTNYTLGQTGLANSGTGGLPATNTTCCAAARQNNASSEDAGAWTIAGTLSNWSAWTLAIHPAAPIGSEVSNTLPPRIEKKPYIITSLNSLPPDVGSPFIPVDYPNPKIGRSIRTSTVSRLIDDNDIAFHQLDWTNPRIENRKPLTWINNNQSDVLAPIVAPPFTPVDYPNPGLKRSLRPVTNSRLVDDANIAFNQLDWPNPAPARKSALTFIFNKQLEPPVVAPFTPVEFRNPDLRKLQNTGSTVNRPQYYTDLNPNNQYNWPNPGPKKLKHDTWVQNLLQSTLAPIITQLPFSNTETAFVRRKPYILTDISSGINISPVDKPFVTPEYPNPRRKSYIIVGLNTIFQSSSDKPFKQDDYPNPAGRKLKTPNTWVFSRKLDDPTTAFAPCSVTEWDVPAPGRRTALTHISIIPQLQQLFTTPIGIPLVSTHVLRRKRETLSWVNPRPFYYQEAVVFPFGNLEWKMPIEKRTLLVSHVQKFIDVTIVGNPFSQKDWSNPVVKKRLPITWEFYYQQDDNQPPVAQSVTVPVLRRKSQNLGYIFTSQISQENPTKTYDYPNPIIVRQHNKGFILNLLESTLNPGAGAVPFNQNDYPNPQIGKRNFHLGITLNKPTYYTEEPLQPNQYDWPIFRAVKRNHVGYINTVIPPEFAPRVANIVDVPFTKKGVIPVWAYSSLQIMATPEGLRPFSQNEWLVFRNVKRATDLLTWIQSKSINLPDIIGRKICLDSNITIYDLESALEEYEFDSSLTIYDIESGGTECQ